MGTEQYFRQAKEYIAGGVNSPVRAFGGVGGTPVFMKRAEGAYLFDESEKRYIDFVNSWGAMIIGHNHPCVVQEIRSQCEQGLGFGTPTILETHFAQKLIKRFPSMEKIRMVNSGTEAVMSAVRLARGYTGRDNILKFTGCYHGHSDGLLVKSGSGLATFGVPSSAGIPKGITDYTITLDYNDIDSIDRVFSEYGDTIAAVIVEPVAGNMNCVAPIAGFLEALHRVCSTYGALLIFDEVITGCRVSAGGAQQYYGIDPDITILGKIVGGGLPVGVFGGKSDIMEYLSPNGPVYQAGTLSGNPLTVVAGLSTLSVIEQDPNFYDILTKRARYLVDGIVQVGSKHGISVVGHAIGGMFGLFFDEVLPQNFVQVSNGNHKLFSPFFQIMLEHGIYMAPSAFESGFVSSVHSEEDIEYTIQHAEKAFSILKKI